MPVVSSGGVAAVVHVRSGVEYHLAGLDALVERCRRAPGLATDPRPVTERSTAMPTILEVAARPVAERIARLERTPDDFAAAIEGRSDAVLSRRPDAKNWAPRRSCATCAIPRNCP